MLSIFSILFFFPMAFAEIKYDYNCSVWIASNRFAYTAGASNCENTLSDAACRVFYKEKVAGDGIPVEGKYMDRPITCFSSDTTSPSISNDMKAVAIANCPKTCGYCCQTPAFKCSNVQFPRLNCATITSAQCNSPTWRTIIAQDCPAACGFCNQGGCVDAVLDCANDASICTTVGMQEFVNTYCQRTCSRCPSTTVASSSGSSATSCTSFISDSSSACTGWAANGFCTNTFYTVAQRKAYCATTCRLC